MRGDVCCSGDGCAGGNEGRDRCTGLCESGDGDPLAKLKLSLNDFGRGCVVLFGSGFG